MKPISDVWEKNGNKVRFTFIDSDDEPKFTPVTQAYAICFDKEGNVFIGQCPPGFDHWTLPGGTLEKGETPLQALHREVDEELSLEIQRSQLLGAQRVEYLNKRKRLHYQLRYVALVVAKPLTADPDWEQLWIRKLIPASEFLTYIQWGPIGEHMIRRAREIFSSWKLSTGKKSSARNRDPG